MYDDTLVGALRVARRVEEAGGVQSCRICGHANKFRQAAQLVFEYLASGTLSIGYSALTHKRHIAVCKKPDAAIFRDWVVTDHDHFTVFGGVALILDLRGGHYVSGQMLLVLQEGLDLHQGWIVGATGILNHGITLQECLRCEVAVRLPRDIRPA